MGLVYLQMMQSRQGSAFMQPVPQFGDGPATMEEISDREIADAAKGCVVCLQLLFRSGLCPITL